ncbi:JmjC domain-containing protein [Moritella dasanensis]|uniref:JmjC domain-containing protein n=1 Tax=Moritella dasanensis TaxID=428031 RepID=UPI0002E20733|nr:cupin domain-containing protein [Moritella dasanensis]
MSNTEINLQSLIGDNTKEEFLKLLESQTPFVSHGNTESLKDLMGLPFLKSVENLAAYWQDTVDVFNPQVADEISKTSVSPEDAINEYYCGNCILFNDVNRMIPEFDMWNQKIRKEIGFSELTYVRNLVYASPAGKGNAPHFDQNFNFVVQLEGTKKWWLAENKTINNPMTRHVIGHPVDHELAGYADKEFPEAFPADCIEYILEPGSILFVPRGVWHMTEAVTDAVSFNFTFTPPTWIDIATAVIREKLSHSEKWRESAIIDDNGVSNSEFNELLKDLSADVKNWNAVNFLDVTENQEL